MNSAFLLWQASLRAERCILHSALLNAYWFLHLFLPLLQVLEPCVLVLETEGLDVTSTCEPVVHIISIGTYDLHISLVRQMLLTVGEMRVSLVILLWHIDAQSNRYSVIYLRIVSCTCPAPETYVAPPTMSTIPVESGMSATGRENFTCTSTSRCP